MSKLKHIQPVKEQQDFIDIDDAASDNESNEQQHAKLLNAISKLEKKRFKVNLRTEPVSKISEHALVQVGSDEGLSKVNKVRAEDLLKVITHPTRLNPLKNKLKNTKQGVKKIKAPLEKPQALRIERTAGYEKIKEEVSRWEDVVKKNEIAEQLVFPLNQPSLKVHSTSDFTKKFKAKTPLEEQISALLTGNKNVHAEDQELTPAEQEALASMSLKEALQRRRELARSRALQSYQEAKARRQNKIKSKTYHRLLKKERMNNHLKEFETLKERDPEAALQKLELLDRKRIEERMTLKHKGAGKWAKLQAIRSKYDTNAREALADQLRMGKEITRKAKISDDESEEDIPSISVEKSDNPWLIGSQSSESKTEITSGYRKLWNNINQGKETKRTMNKDSTISKNQQENVNGFVVTEVNSTAKKIEQQRSNAKTTLQVNERVSHELKETRTRIRGLEDIDTKLLEDTEEYQTNQIFEEMDENVENFSSKWNSHESTEDLNHEKETRSFKNIDPNKFLLVSNAVVLNSSAPTTEMGNEEDDEKDHHRMTLAEAFADDDVIEEFKEEKRKTIDEATPKDIDLTMPGWGDWGGAGIEISEKKRKKFRIKAPPAAKRKDTDKKYVIINEDRNKTMRRQKVNDLPLSFRSTAAFESAIRAPITSTFIPETAARKLSAPKVVTKIGTVIAPMTDDGIILTANSNQKASGLKNDKGNPSKGAQGRKRKLEKPTDSSKKFLKRSSRNLGK